MRVTYLVVIYLILAGCNPQNEDSKNDASQNSSASNQVKISYDHLGNKSLDDIRSPNHAYTLVKTPHLSLALMKQPAKP
jgi:hypothetical protein